MAIDDLASHWLDAMVRACWQGFLAAVVVFLSCRLILRKASPSSRATLWWLAGLKTLIAFALGISIAIPIAAPTKSPFTQIQSRLDLLAPNVRPANPTATAPEISKPSAPTPRGDAVAAQQVSFVAFGMLAWVFGMIGIAIWTTRQVFRLKSLVQDARPLNNAPLGEELRRMGATIGLDSRPLVAESSKVTAPMVVGLLRPVVLVPVRFADGLSDEEIQMALAHELAHIRRRDLLIGIVPTICQILFFFFPPIWLVLREWSLEREAACDAEALTVTSGSPTGYGRMLMKIVTRDHEGGLMPALGATANYHTLKKRLEMIKSFTNPGRFARFAAVTLVAAGLLLTLPWRLSARVLPVADNNLIKNAGFEDEGGLARWVQGSIPPGQSPPVSISLDTSVAHSGKASLKFEKTENRYFPVALVSQQIAFEPGQSKIKVGVWAKAEEAAKATVAVMFQGGEGKVEWGAYIGAQNPGDALATHDWKHYGAVLSIPPGTTSINIALEMYGPGTVWMDDITAAYVPAGTPLQSAILMAEDKAEDPLADVKDIPSADLKVGKDPMKRYFLVGPNKGTQPAEGYKLLLVMPGGDGSADFNPFVRRISKFALPDNYIVAELVAPKWSDDQFAQLVWPTRKVKFTGMRFATEDFVESVVADVSKKFKIDPAKVFTLSWSSGGPAAYATGLAHGSVKGSLVAMSIFRPTELPPLFEAKGLPFYILHSPDDRLVPIAQAQSAADQLKSAGAITKLVSYSGGHGWHGDIFGSIHDGITWLEAPKAK